MGYFKMAKATRTEPSEKGFRAYWDWFKRSETKKGHSLDDVPSPYDLEEVDDVGFDIWSQHLVSIIQSRPSLESFLNTTRVSRV
ncbi:uncharacterized protein CTRU02_206515 [Colletotrichum truncatum]|uniref:Uncharacterized protein n=1 Tax=Colletotrichum truncatum TaxID=5467 RepID=A0ACC3Z765_COLTU|nr:uncharacterized protein CTRU02_11887 [Colletotrichum truncatum]KAF6785262.1 hypothetical protein CTRU02_11887 [Colletotrichum truncatum]